MDPMVQSAVRNNAALCTAVCRSHGVAVTATEELWVTDGPAPVLYPDVITARQSVQPPDVSSALGYRSGVSVKDSFADLSLVDEGFTKLFGAQWISRPTEPDDAGGAAGGWAKVDEDGLWMWVQASGLKSVILPSLLEEENILVAARYEGGEPVAGFIANRTGSTAGISNVFAVDGAADPWPDVARQVGRHWQVEALVGYESGRALERAQAAGFRPIGPLTVWLKD